MAQSVARRLGKAEAGGSSPLDSFFTLKELLQKQAEHLPEQQFFFISKSPENFRTINGSSPGLSFGLYLRRGFFL